MKRGFTLIEVVVVLFVLALATALVTPAIGRGMETLRMRTEVAGVAAFLRHARAQAITRGESHEVRLDTDARLLVLTASRPEAVRASRRLSGDLRIEAGAPGPIVVRFSPQGLSSASTLRIEGSGGRGYVLTVEPLTGRVLNRREDS